MVKSLNVPIDEQVIEGAKSAARRSGMLLRGWVERALVRAIADEKPHPETRERTYEPAE